MAKYLVNDNEAKALAKLVKSHQMYDSLGWDYKKGRPAGNFPFRFKTLEAMGATTANKANAAIWFFGGTTDNLADTNFVVDDSSALTNASSGTRGVCFASSEYHILTLSGSTATQYMGLASTAYSSTDLNIVIDTLEPMDGSGTTLTTLTAYNKFAWNVLNNGDCCIKWNQYSSRYDLIQTKCT